MDIFRTTSSYPADMRSVIELTAHLGAPAFYLILCIVFSQTLIAPSFHLTHSLSSFRADLHHPTKLRVMFHDTDIGLPSLGAQLTHEAHPKLSSKPTLTMSLLGLPPEVILLIGENLTRGKDILSLLLTNRHLSQVLPRLLHPFAIQDRDGLGALQWAASNNHCFLIQLLLQKGFTIDSQPHYKNSPTSRRPHYQSTFPYSSHRHRGTALFRAVMYGHEDAARLLLQKGASPNIRDKVIGETPLHLAANEGKESMVRLLLDNGADHSVKTRHGATALHIAVYSRNEPAVRALLAAGADPDTCDGAEMSSLHIALRNLMSPTCIKIIKHFIEGGARVDGGVLHAGKTALYVAAGSGHEELVEMVLKHGGKVTDLCEDGKTALHGAVSEGAIRLLLDAGVDITAEDNEGYTALDLAALNSRQGGWNYEPRILLLLEEGAHSYTSETLLSVLVWAVEKGRRDVLEKLFGYGVDLTAFRQSNGYTALHIAVSSGRVDMAQTILEQGVDISIKDRQGATALHIAVLALQSHDMMELLLKKGIDVNAVDSRGNTALDITYVFSTDTDDQWREGVIRLLEDNGASRGGEQRVWFV